MNILAIDTTTDKITLGLKARDEEFFYVGESGSKRHNETLLTQIDFILDKAGINVRELDVVGVVCGPGSFTGIRIGVATANAISMATKCKTVEITSLEQSFDGTDKIVLLDCGHNNYYAAIFEQGKVSYTEISVEQIADQTLKIEYLTESNPQKILKKCIEKAEKGDFVEQSKPFYMKKSSAERE